MRMKKVDKRSSDPDLEDKMEFTDDSFEIMEIETDRNRMIPGGGGARSTTAASTSSEDAPPSRGSNVSSRGNQSQHSVMSTDISQLLNDGVPVVGVLHDERVQSFEGKGWPYNRNQCTPEKLALAGFEYLQRNEPAVKCVFCGLTLEKLALLSDPWQLHEIKRPTCSYVQLGKRNSPGEYSYKEMLNLYLNAKVLAMADLYVATEVENKHTLGLLANEDETISI